MNRIAIALVEIMQPTFIINGVNDRPRMYPEGNLPVLQGKQIYLTPRLASDLYA